MDPEAIREVLNLINDFPKPTLTPLSKFLITGLVDLDGDKWSKHRKIINPAFNLAKLKVFFSHYILCQSLTLNFIIYYWSYRVCQVQIASDTHLASSGILMILSYRGCIMCTLNFQVGLILWWKTIIYIYIYICGWVWGDEMYQMQRNLKWEIKKINDWN